MSHTRNRNRMPRWQRLAIDAGALALGFTGVMWLLLHHAHWPQALQAPIEGLPSPWEPWLIKLHGAAMLLIVFLVGRVSTIHLARGWRLRRRRGSGVAVLATLCLLTLSGYALYYLVPDDLRDLLGWWHSALGGLWVIALAAHRC